MRGARPVVALALLALIASPAACAADDARAVVGFVTGHGELALDGQLSQVAERLREDHDVTEVDLSGGTTALAGVDVLIVAGRPDIPDVELYELDQFLMRGGRAAFLVDAAVVPPDGTHALVSDANIFGFLSVYGLTVNADLVLDRECAEGAVWGAVATSSLYVCWPVVGEKGIAGDHPAVSRLTRLHFPWTSSIELDHDTLDRAGSEVLVHSSPESWTTPAYSDIAPIPALEPPSEPDDVSRVSGANGFPLVIAVEGELRSAFAGKQLIVQNGSDARFVDPVGMIEVSEPLRLVVVGNSMMFWDDLAEQLPGNAEFLDGLVDWLASEVGAASSAVDERPEADRATGRGRTQRLIGIIALALALAVASLAVTRFARSRARGRSPRTRR